MCCKLIFFKKYVKSLAKVNPSKFFPTIISKSYRKPFPTSNQKSLLRRLPANLIFSNTVQIVATGEIPKPGMNCSSRFDQAGLKNRSRKALVTTETELMAMAPPAIIGFRVGPPKIYNRPAATGMPTTL